MKTITQKLLIGAGDDKEMNYTSFASFEAGTQGEGDMIVGIISPTSKIISEIKLYVSHKFYEVGPRDLCLFTDAGLLLGYKKNFEWVSVLENFDITPDLQSLDQNTLNELIDDTLNRVFWSVKKEERQRIVDSILRSSFQELARRIADDVNFLDNIEWRDLERILGEALSALGFNVTVTPPSKDGGKDIIAHLDVFNNQYSFVIELKHWRSGKRVDLSPVDKFLRVVINEKRTGGLFLASYGYTEDCIEAIASFKRYNLNLGDGNKIYSIFQVYKQKIGGQVLAPADILSMVSSGIEGV